MRFDAGESAYVILGALAVVVVVIAMAWFLVLRRLDEGNFEAGGPLHPPWTPARLRFLGGFLGAATADESHARLSYWDVRSRDLTRRKIATLPDRGAVSRGVGGTTAQGHSGTPALASVQTPGRT